LDFGRSDRCRGADGRRCPRNHLGGDVGATHLSVATRSHLGDIDDAGGRGRAERKLGDAQQSIEGPVEKRHGLGGVALGDQMAGQRKLAWRGGVISYSQF
jgi:hypothetical protein